MRGLQEGSSSKRIASFEVWTMYGQEGGPCDQYDPFRPQWLDFYKLTSG